jgi:cytochrome c oxidase subunit II
MTTILGIIIVICILLVIFYVARTVDLTKELKGELDDTVPTSNVQGYLMFGFLIAFFIGITWSSMYFVPKMLPTPSSVHGVAIEKLFNMTLFFTGIVFLITHIVLFWFVFKYREKRGAKAYHFSHSNMLELLWTAIPAVVMLILVVKGLVTWLSIFPNTKTLSKETMVIEVTAQQFKWNIRYPGLDKDFGARKIDTAHIGIATPDVWWKNELGIDWTDKASHDDFFADTIYLVKNKPVLMKLGALDVLHSFYLPHFRVKMDCVPGVPTTFYFIPNQTTVEKRKELSALPEWQKINPATGAPKYSTFNFELACAELCGRSHYTMQRYVVVVEQAEYDQWVKEHTPIYAGIEKAQQAALEKEKGTTMTIQPGMNDSTKVVVDSLMNKKTAMR